MRARQIQNSKARLSAAIILFQIMFAALFGFLMFFLKIGIEKSDFNLKYFEYVVLSFFAIVFVFLWFLLRMGIKRYFFILAKGETAKFRNIFYFFHCRKIKRTASYLIYFFALKTIYFFICVFPIALSFMFFYHLLSTGISNLAFCVLALWILGICICCTVFYRKFTRRYFLTPYIFFESEEKKNSEIKEESSLKMKKENAKLFKLKLSFSLWFLFCAFIISIPFVFGYYKQTLCVFAIDKIDKNKA